MSDFVDVKKATVFGPASSEVTFSSEQWALTDEVAELVSNYMDAGVYVSGTSIRWTDEIEPERGAVVPSRVLTDSVYYWSESSAYYIRHYGFSPGVEFIQHVINSVRNPKPVPEDAATTVLSQHFVL